MRDIYTIFQLPSYKNVSLFEILVKWGTILPPGSLPWEVGKKMIFQILLYMRDTNTNFWLPSSKPTVTLLEIVVMDAISPPWILPGGKGDWFSMIYIIWERRNTLTDFQLPTFMIVKSIDIVGMGGILSPGRKELIFLDLLFFEKQIPIFSFLAPKLGGWLS